jgi:hypothetical protein
MKQVDTGMAVARHAPMTFPIVSQASPRPAGDHVRDEARPRSRDLMSRTGLVALVVANLFVVLQTVRHDWGYYETLLIFWTEVVILGAYNVLRMMVVGVFGARPLGSWAAQRVDLGGRLDRFIFTVIGVGFFLIKFAGFALTVGLFVLLLPAMLGADGEGGRNIHRALASARPGLLTATGALCLSHGVSFVRNFLLGREYDWVSIVSLVFWPYARMSLVCAVLVAGIAIARLLPALGQETGFAGMMVLLKLLADAATHTLEHSRYLADSPDRGVVAANELNETDGCAIPFGPTPVFRAQRTS